MKTIPCPECDGTGKIVDQRDLAAALRKLRIDAGIPLRDMADHLKISAAYLSDLEHGNRRFRIDMELAFRKKCNGK